MLFPPYESDYESPVAYQRARMWNALGFGVAALVCLGLIMWLLPEVKGDSFLGLLALDALIGFYGFFSHRKEAKKLLSRQEQGATQASS